MRNLIHGGWQAEVLRAVLRLDLPDLLGDRRRSVADLAGASGADEEALARLLRLAAALGLFRQLDADYYTNNAASSLLRADHPRSMRVEAMHALSGWTRIAWDQVAFSVRSGTSGFQAATGVSVFEFLRSEPD